MALTFSYQEIAKKLGIKPQTLSSYISKNPEAVNKLKKYFIIKEGTTPGNPITYTLKKNFNLANAIKDIKTEIGRTPVHATPAQKLFVSQEVSKANAGERYVTAEEILEKVKKKFNKPTKPSIRLYPVLSTLDTRAQKADQVLKNMLMEKTPLNGYWNEVAAKRVGMHNLSFRRMLEDVRTAGVTKFRGAVPTYEVLKDQGADFISGKGGKGMAKTGGAYSFITKLSFSDQLAKALEIQQGIPILKQIGSRANTPKMKAMHFAFRNWALNQGKGDIQLFDKKGKFIPYEYGKAFDAKDISFKYKGKMFSLRDRPYKINNISDPTVLKKYFPEVERITNEMNNFGQKKIDNPFKPGSKIEIKDLVKKVQVDGYGFKPRLGSLAILHGPKGVKGEPFTNLVMNTTDVNIAEASLANSLKANKISGTDYNNAVKNLRGMFKGTTGPEYRQSIIDRLGTQAKGIQKYKGTNYPFSIQDLVKDLIKEVKGAPGSCQAILRKQTGGIATTCVEAIKRDPVGSANKLATMEATSGALGKVKNAATTFLGILGRGGVKAAPYAAIAAVGAAAEPLVKQFRNDDPSTYLSNPEQQKGMLLSMVEQETPKVDEEILKWQYPGLAGATAAGAIPGAGAVYKARRGLPPTKDFVGPMQKGVGKTRAALGIRGVLGKALGASFSPLAVAATLPISVAAQREGGSSLEDIATDPFNWMGPAFASSGAELATKGMKPTGILSKALRLGMKPSTLRMISSRFGLPGLALSAGLKGYDIWQNSKYK